MAKVIPIFKPKSLSPMREALQVEYRYWLRRKLVEGYWNDVLLRMSNMGILDTIESILDRVIAERGDGTDDKEFMEWTGLPDYYKGK